MNASELAELCDGTGNTTTATAGRVTAASGSLVTVTVSQTFLLCETLLLYITLSSGI